MCDSIGESHDRNDKTLDVNCILFLTTKIQVNIDEEYLSKNDGALENIFCTLEIIHCKMHYVEEETKKIRWTL